jgi:superfamily I DNA and/or RNA helicase
VTAYGSAAGRKLKTQYRMLPAIGRLVSDTFYPEIKLEHGRDKPEIDPSVLPSDLGVPLTWIATDSFGEQGFESLEAGGTSRINRVEADCLLTLLTRWYEHEPFREWLTTQTLYPHGVGVICMYAAQRDHLRSRLLKASHGNTLLRHVKVDTVDATRGKKIPSSCSRSCATTRTDLSGRAWRRCGRDFCRAAIESTSPSAGLWIGW